MTNGPQIIPIYAAALALLFLFLSVRVIGARRRHGVALGLGKGAEIERPSRVHANFAEYVPLALLLLLMAELRGADPAMLHLAGAALLAGRAAHAWGMSREPELLPLRVAGMAATFTVIAGAAALILAT